MAPVVKNLPANADVGSIPGSGRSPGVGHGNLLSHSILAWGIPWTEEPRGLQPTGLKRVRHDCSDLAHTHTVQPAPLSVVHCYSWAPSTDTSEHPNSIVYIRANPCRTFYRIWQITGDVHPPMYRRTEYFHCPKTLRSARSPLPLLCFFLCVSVGFFGRYLLCKHKN